VGTGFHPELSGRDNIFLNGAILGMSKQEIKSKFDEIVDFSGVERYLDTPVKRYSSGMYVRLAFAVAAHLEPDILIVDEVLAVGDAEFQKKCLGKMKDVSVNDGRTVLFVSHNLSAVKELCDKGIVMENGQLVASSSVSEALSFYSLNNTGSTLKDLNNPKFHSGASQYSQIINLNVLDTVTLEKKTTFLMGDDILIKVQLKIKKQMPNVEVGIKLSSINGVALSYFVSDWEGLSGSLEQGLHEFSIKIPQIPFLPGKYFLSPWVLIKGHASDDSVQEAVLLEIIQDDINGHMAYFDKYAYSGCEVYLPSSWEKVNNN
jgi:lipopolysaccharide transport system ATP-binding protein